MLVKDARESLVHVGFPDGKEGWVPAEELFPVEARVYTGYIGVIYRGYIGVI